MSWLSPDVKGCGLFLWTNLNPLHPGMLFAKFAWNWPSGSVEEEFKFSLVNNYLLEKCVALHWINLYTLHPRMLVLSLVEIAPLVLEKTILKFRQCILIISILSPHRNGRGSSFEQTWFPLIQRWFVQILVEVGRVVLEKFLKFVNLFFCQFIIISPWKR